MVLYFKAVTNQCIRILNNPWCKFSHLALMTCIAFVFILSRISFNDWYSQISISLFQMYEIAGILTSIVLVISRHRFVANQTTTYEAMFYFFAFTPFTIIKCIVTDPFRRIRRRKRCDDGWICFACCIPILIFLILNPIIDKQKDVLFIVTILKFKDTQGIIVSLYLPFVLLFCSIYVNFLSKENFERLAHENDLHRAEQPAQINRANEEDIGSELSDVDHIYPYARYEATTRIFTPSIDEKIKNTHNQGCAICLAESVEPKDRSYLPCLHYFHRDCIHSWFCTRHSCPVCRKAIRIAF